jgi:2'-5' RNA ligase
MHLEGLGAFPDMRRARVWWIGVRPSRSLETVHFAIEDALGRLGFEPEARTFHPHLTVARAMREARRVDAAAVATAAASFGYQAPMEVETVDLMRSDLRRSGAIYTAVQRFQLIPR